MNATAIEAPDRPVNVEEQARVVMGLLREYSGKLATLTGELLVTPVSIDYLHKTAWLLDQSELMRKPLLSILSRGSSIREHAQLEPLLRDEMSLRLSETEVHLHHAIRLTLFVRDRITKRSLTDDLAQLRFSAGLPAGA